VNVICFLTAVDKTMIVSRNGRFVPLKRLLWDTTEYQGNFYCLLIVLERHHVF